MRMLTRPCKHTNARNIQVMITLIFLPLFPTPGKDGEIGGGLKQKSASEFFGLSKFPDAIF